MEEDEDEQYRNVLDKHQKRIVEVLNPMPLLDEMLATDLLHFAQCRDIKEAENTSAMNRKIIDTVRSKGSKSFKRFIGLLRETGNGSVLDMLTTRELKETKKESHNTRLQQHLLNIYKTSCVWEDPITNDQQSISELYVPPAVKLMRERDERRGLVEVKQHTSQSWPVTYQNIFFSQTGPCKNIYITGEAGTGKTTLCNQLVLNWSNAVQNANDMTISSEDRNIMSSFQFLFYINLRDTEESYNVEDMIKDQLMYDAPIVTDISVLLKKEKCLIILDGLDEWQCPDGVKKCPRLNKSIPGRNATNETVFLTTTRNWKFDVSDLKPQDVDKHVELGGIDKASSKELAQKMFAYLDRKEHKETNIDGFYDEIHRKNLDELMSVPVLFIQLMTLWHYGKDFGNSQLQLYCNMLELLFECSEKNMSEKQLECIGEGAELPDCLSENDCCQVRKNLLLCLAKLAYESLFGTKKREDALVFKSSKLTVFGISPSDIKLCLKCGILSQSRDFRKYVGKFKKFSFLHKTMQEFLAAVHIATVESVEDVMKRVREFCNSLDIMLELSQVWLFVSGIRPDITRELLQHFSTITTGEERIQNYRQCLDDNGLIRDIQTFVTDCVTEGRNNGHTYDVICVEDLYISRHTISHVERLIPGNVGSRIKSINIDTRFLTIDQLRAVTGLAKKCQTLQLLGLYDPESDIPSETVSTITQNCSDHLLRVDFMTLPNKMMLIDSTVNAICYSITKCLMSLRLVRVTLTHNDKIKLLNELSQSITIRELVIDVRCSEHRQLCRPTIDVSTLTQLRRVLLRHICIENLQSVSECIETVDVLGVTLSETCLCEFARRLSETLRDCHVTVELEGVSIIEANEDSADHVTSIRSLPGLIMRRYKVYKDDNGIKSWRIMFDKTKNENLDQTSLR